MKEIEFLEVSILKEYNENKYESCTALEYLHRVLGEDACKEKIDIRETRRYANWDSTRF